MSGVYFNPLKRIFLNLSGGTVTGDTVFTQGLYANSLSGGTIYSGATELELIIQNIAASVVSSSATTLATYVQPGSNITTGGTALAPIVSVVSSPSFNDIFSSGSTQLNNLTVVSLSGGTISASILYSGSTNLQDTFDSLNSQLETKASLSGDTFTGAVVAPSLSASTISGDTLYSGSTNLYDIFLTVHDGNDITRVQPGSNIITGGTGNLPIISVVASPSFNNLSFSGTATGSALSATSISATTFFSGSTPLQNIFNTINGQLNTKANLSGATFTGAVIAPSLSATTISGGTLYSGSTNLYNIFSTVDTNDITRVQPGVNTYTGGTANSPTVNVSALTINTLSVSGTTNFTGALQSGGTNLYSIFSTTDNNDITRVQPGSNITTGGTGNSPIISVVASPIFNSIISSGTSQLNVVTAVSITGGTISGGTLYSGSTPVQSIINVINSQLSTKANLSGATFTGAVIAPSLSATTISGGTLFSGSTNLYNIFSTIDTNDVTRVQPGSNITTGGTANLPTISVVSSPSFNSISASGNSTFAGVTVTAITDSQLINTQVVYAGVGGILKSNSGFTFDDSVGNLYSNNIQIGTPSLSGNVTIWGNVNVMGQAISAFTSQLLIQDNNISLNYNPTANTSSTSLGAGFTIQDGSGVAGTDVFFDVRGTGTTLNNRSFSTNIYDIRIRESGSTSSPNGVRLLAENDELNGGIF